MDGGGKRARSRLSETDLPQNQQFLTYHLLLLRYRFIPFGHLHTRLTILTIGLFQQLIILSWNFS